MRFCPVCHERYDDAAQFCPRDGEPLPVDEADQRIGTVLMGQFELLEVIGKGAMGTVYRAWQTGMERQVAIKILRPELMRDPKVVARFDREARAVAKLQHPNIVTFFLVGDTDDGVPFLAMEHVDGESLAEILDREGVLDTGRALHIALQITSALTEAHAEGIVHRDLKPANILLTQRRRMPDFVKVLDFGIAKILRGESESREEVESRLTREGTIFGTPHYIAPEQAAGSDVDHRADLYSLGCVLFRMLTGKLPFEGAGIAVLLAHIGQPPPRPSEILPDIDPRLETVILKAMEKDPAARFQSAEELADALEKVGASRPAPPPSAEVSPARPLPRAETSPPHLPVESRDIAVEVGLADPSRTPTVPPPAVSPPPRRSPSVSRQSLSPPAGESVLPVIPRRKSGAWAAVLGLVLAGGAAAAAVMVMDHKPGPGAPPVATTTPSPQVTPPPAPPPEAPVEDKTVAAVPHPTGDVRIVTVGEAGFAIRCELPQEPRIGVTYSIRFDVYDPDGAALAAPSIEATFEDPDDKDQKVTAAAVAGAPGRYVLERTFEKPGRQHVHLFPSPTQPDLHIWFDLMVADAGGKVPAEPVARSPKGKRRSPLASSGIQMIAPEPPPKPLAEPAGGDGASDPYHDNLVEEEPLKEPPPPPVTPPKRRPKPPKPNPDGLE